MKHIKCKGKGVYLQICLRSRSLVVVEFYTTTRERAVPRSRFVVAVVVVVDCTINRSISLKAIPAQPSCLAQSETLITREKERERGEFKFESLNYKARR